MITQLATPTRPQDVALWESLSEESRLALVQHAMRKAAETLTLHALVLAEDVEDGALPDRGASHALRLFAGMTHAAISGDFACAGHA